MWCAECNADVAAEFSPETGRATCAACKTELATAAGLSEKARHARELLEKWSQEEVADPRAPLPYSAATPMASEAAETSAADSKANDLALESTAEARSATGFKDTARRSAEDSPPATTNGEIAPIESGVERLHADTESSTPIAGAAAEKVVASSTAETVVKSKASKRTLRIDSAEPLESRRSPERQRTRRRPRTHRFEEAHGSRVPEPHLDFRTAGSEQQPNWSVTAGQWLAYLGVLALTIGTSIVVYGHFGGYANYTPTGWLVTTVGQMLLFLGVINLVSGGMEQSNDEVSQRIEALGQHILRIESATENLRGPHIPPEAFTEDSDYDYESARSRESAIEQG